MLQELSDEELALVDGAGYPATNVAVITQLNIVVAPVTVVGNVPNASISNAFEQANIAKNYS